MHPARAYAWYSFLIGFAFSSSVGIYVPFLLGIGLTLADVAFINTFFWGSIILFELPTGMLADGKSRGWSIRAGLLLHAGATAYYATVGSFGGAIVAETVAGIAAAFLSGAQQAWVVDALARRGEAHLVGKTFGHAAMTRALGFVLGGAAGALIGIVSFRAAWIMESLTTLVALGIVVRCFNGDGEPEHRVGELKAFRLSLAALRRSRALLWTVLAAASFGLVLPFNHYWTPFFRERVGQAGLAALWVPMYLTLAAAGAYIRFRRVREGREALGIVVAIMLAGTGLAFVGMPTMLAASISLVLLHEFGRGLFDPLLDSYTAAHAESSYRATFGSLQSFLGRFGNAAVLIGVWWGTRGLPTTDTTITRIWEVAGALLVVAALGLWFFRPRR